MPFYGSGSCGSCCLCPLQGSGASMGEGAWEVGAVAYVSPAQEGKMPDMACQGGARMVWELKPVHFSGFRVQHGMGAGFSMLFGCCCLCHLQGSGSSMVWEQSSIACGCFCLCPLWAACVLFTFQGPA